MPPLSKEEILAYQERWAAVNEFERNEFAKLSLEERWEQLNAIYGLAKALGLDIQPDETEEEIYLRWAILKQKAGNCQAS